MALTPPLLALMGVESDHMTGATAATSGDTTYTDTTSVAGGEAFIRGEDDDADDDTGVNSNDVAQGNVQDCYFMAAMMAVARANPQKIKDLIQEKADGTYDVTLYVEDGLWSDAGAKTVNVTADFPSRNGKFQGATAGDDKKELWPMLLEKAWAIHRGSYTGMNQGMADDAMRALTGSDSDDVLHGLWDDRKKPGYIIEQIEGWLVDRRALMASTKEMSTSDNDAAKKKFGAGFSHDHSYAVKAASGSAGTITLENPWAGQADDVVMAAADLRTYLDAIYLLDD